MKTPGFCYLGTRAIQGINCLNAHAKCRKYCVREKMNLFYLITVIFSLESTINWLKTKKLQKSNYTCPDCNILCSWTRNSSKTDQYFWRCLHCKRKFSIRHGSFFKQSHLNLRVLLVAIIYLFSLKIPLNICKNCCVQWFRIMF